MSRSMAGARPVATTRSSIAGLTPSMTARTSFLFVTAQDPQPRVLLTLPATTGQQQPRDERQRDERDGRGEDRERGEHEREAVRVERQRVLGRRVEPRAGAAEQAADRRLGERGARDARSQPRPWGVVLA